MAPVASPAADQTTDLTLESKTKAHDAAEVTKKPSSGQYGSGNGGEAPDVSVPPRESTLTPLLQEMNQMIDPANMYYMPSGYPSTAYYYGGYGGSVTDWDEYSRYMNQEGVEMSSAVYGVMYNHGYGYLPYGAYPSPGSPVPTMGNDGQMYGTQQYQYPTQYYQSPTPNATYTPSQVYGDMYNHGYGYFPYGAYPSPGSPVPTMGNDGQMYGTQQYQYPTQYYQSPTPNATYTPSQGPSTHGISASAAADQLPPPADTVKATSNVASKGNANGINVSAPVKTNHQNSSLASNGAYGRGGMPGGPPASGYQDLGYSSGTMRSSTHWTESTPLSAGQNRPATLSSSYSYNNNNNFSARYQNQRPLPHLTGLHTQRPASDMGSAAPGYMNKMYPNSQMYGSYGNTYRTGFGYGPNSYDSRMNGYWNLPTDNKYRPRGRGSGVYGYANESLDGFSELNRGPRAGRFKNLKAVGPNVTIAAKGQNLSSIAMEDSTAVLPNREQYNREDFPETYSNAKFFIIKSYSEDDVHKSIKYGVWASTPNGNKKLDAAYKEAQEKAGECPVFLLFSVNTSGQFVGLAEMVGPVDFEKTVDYWQQAKWFGCFSVKWHIVKDIPNSILKHITLDNNDNKPVTNSRDTQEVKLEQGLQVLKLFKEHVSKTSILDDFEFYETRQKLVQEKRAKQQQQFQKQELDGKTSEVVDEKDKDVTTVKLILQKPSESAPLTNSQTGQDVVGAVSSDAPISEEQKSSEENIVGAVSSDAPDPEEQKTSEKNTAGEASTDFPGPEEQNSSEEKGAATVESDAPKVVILATEKPAAVNGVANGF